jgi:hypothetical protein
VIYIDTTEGQVSFHVRAQEYGDLAPYTGQWSGNRDSDQVLIRLHTASGKADHLPEKEPEQLEWLIPA